MKLRQIDLDFKQLELTRQQFDAETLPERCKISVEMLKSHMNQMVIERSQELATDKSKNGAYIG